MLRTPIRSPISSAISGVFERPRRFFSPYSLFAAGEQGAWYDPSDWSTLFQDAAGTTPVTAVEQPVGLMLDKSKGLVLGPELVVNGDFSNGTTGWAAGAGVTIAGGVANLNVSSYAGLINTGALLAGKAYLISITISNFVSGSLRISGGGGSAENLFLPPATGNGVFTGVIRSAGGGSISILGNLSFQGTVDNISVRELPGNHAYQTTSTSRPVLRQDAGGRYYLSFDGVDDFLVTNSIDFTSTDKMTVFAGVRKLSDAATSMVVGNMIDSITQGHIGLFAPSAAVANYSFTTRGTLSGIASSGNSFAAPITNVLTGIGDISGDKSIMRVNGAQVASSTADQGAGNYGNYPLYIGRRGGTTLPFNGYLYSLIVRGAQTSGTQVSQTETWVNGKTGAY